MVAVGTGERTTPAGVERLAGQLLRAGLAHTVLAVPIAQERATMHLDTVCTMVDVDSIVMYPNVAHSLTALAITVNGDDVLRVTRPGRSWTPPRDAMGIDRLHVLDTGLDPVTAEREQWDDGNNTLALAPRVAVAYERNSETNARLEARRHRGRRPSPAASSAAGAADRAACPARSSATPSTWPAPVA